MGGVGRILPLGAQDALIDQGGMKRFCHRLAPTNADKTGVAEQLFQVGKSQNRKMLAAAEKVICESAADALSRIGEIGEPGMISLDHLSSGAVAVGAADPDEAAWLQTPVHFLA